MHQKLTKKQRRAVLLRMRELIAHPRGFTRGTLVIRRKKGLSISVKHQVAKGITPGDYGFCLLGAAEVAVREIVPGFLGDYEDGYHLAGGYYDEKKKWQPAVVDQLSILTLAKARGFDGIPSFNDSPKTKKADVLAVLDERIEAHA